MQNSHFGFLRSGPLKQFIFLKTASLTALGNFLNFDFVYSQVGKRLALHLAVPGSNLGAVELVNDVIKMKSRSKSLIRICRTKNCSVSESN